MTSPAYSIVYSAVLSGTASAGSAGDVLIASATDGLYVRATTANRGTRRSTGIALSSYVANGVVDIQQEGLVTAATSGLGAGTATFVRCSTTGSLERVASPGATDDVVGWCETDGTLHLRCGQVPGGYASAGGGATLPIVLTTDVSGTLPVANGGTGITSLAAGVATWLGSGTSADLATALTDETGTGACVFGTAPLFKTTINLNNPGNTFKYVITPAAIAADRVLTLPLLTAGDTVVCEAFAATLTNKTINGANNTLTVRIANDVSGLAAGVATFLGTPSGANLASALTSALPDTKGGTGLTALGAGVATFLGTPSGANLASALTSALPDTKGGTGLTALGAGVATMLGTFSSANIKTACTDETGSGGALVFATSPTLTTPVINGQTQGATIAIAAMAIDWTLGNVFTKTLAAGANTFTFSGQASGMSITVRVTGAASTLTWPTVKWAGGAAPTQTASGTDVYTFVHDGTSIYGSVVQNMS